MLESAAATPLEEHVNMDQSEMAKSKFATWARNLIQLITNLRALGAQADFDLPRIAVIGNQSAGKSSLVEAISGITVPRATGTCTRCPMECRLANSDEPWQCQILLRRETHEDGHRAPSKEECFGPLLYDKSELEVMIRRAQLAILNPGIPAKTFETLDVDSYTKPEKQLDFSSDVVCLDLCGPGLPDLSFIDLPGIISAVGNDEDKGNIGAIKDMVKEHIKGKTLILLTITMRDDMNNQGAANLAQIADKEGLRTIGVLTKPDLIQEGEEDVWLKILEGSGSHALKHGYFITKHSSPKELEEGVSHSDAREREATFFESTSPWSHKMELRSRMGTPNLTRELSNLLGAVISQSLPKLRQEAKDSLASVTTSLNALPLPPSDNPVVELLRMVSDFSADLQGLVRGIEGSERLLQQCRPAHEQLKSNILSTAPDFRPYNTAADDSTRVDVQAGGASKPDGKGPIYLDDIRSKIRSGSLTRQLPFNVPFSVKVNLIEGCFVDWEAHCVECFDAIHTATLQELQGLAKKHFGGYSGTTLHAEVRMLCDELVEKHRVKTLELVKLILQLEDPPFSLNDHYFISGRERYLTQYKAVRKPPPVAGDPAEIRQLLGLLKKFGLDASPESLAKLHKDDQYEEELVVMAETSAYFRVAYKRVIDNIPRVIDHVFMRAVAKELHNALVLGLSLGTEKATERAGFYLAEDHQVKAERRHFSQKKERLEAALKELYKFQIEAAPLSVLSLYPSSSGAEGEPSVSPPSHGARLASSLSPDNSSEATAAEIPAADIVHPDPAPEPVRPAQNQEATIREPAVIPPRPVRPLPTARPVPTVNSFSFGRPSTPTVQTSDTSGASNSIGTQSFGASLPPFNFSRSAAADGPAPTTPLEPTVTNSAKLAAGTLRADTPSAGGQSTQQSDSTTVPASDASASDETKSSTGSVSTAPSPFAGFGRPRPADPAYKPFTGFGGGSFGKVDSTATAAPSATARAFSGFGVRPPDTPPSAAANLYFSTFGKPVVPSPSSSSGFASGATTSGPSGPPFKSAFEAATAPSGWLSGSNTSSSSTPAGEPFGRKDPATTISAESGGGLFATPLPTATSPFNTSNPSQSRTVDRVERGPYDGGPDVATGTSVAPYQVYSERDFNVPSGANDVMLYHQSITCMPQYRDYSIEELRLQDYQQGRKPISNSSAFDTTPVGGSAFSNVLTSGQRTAGASDCKTQ